MLGIADLHTPEAVAAAESAISGNQHVIPLACSSSSESESEESSDDNISSDNNDVNEKSDDQNTDHGNTSSVKFERSKLKELSHRSKGKGKSKKRPKILELS